MAKCAPKDRKCFVCGCFAPRYSKFMFECPRCDVRFFPAPKEPQPTHESYRDITPIDHSKGTYYIA